MAVVAVFREDGLDVLVEVDRIRQLDSVQESNG